MSGPGKGLRSDDSPGGVPGLASLVVAAATDIGGRSENQDAHGHHAAGARTFLVLCDGMGGHAGGALAANLFVERVTGAAARDGAGLPEAPEGAVQALVGDAAAAIRARADADPGLDPRTTAVLAWADARRTVVAHAGDSRLYRLGPDGVRWRTRDHSLVQRMVDLGQIAPEEAARHPYRHAVLRGVGGPDPPDPEVAVLAPLAPGEALLLCSDGFWEQVSEAEMAGLARAEGLVEALAALVGLAAARGGPHADNATALAAVRPA